MSTDHLFDPGDVDVDQLVLDQLVGAIRPLEDKDLRLLKLHGADNSGQSVVEKMRAAHHQIARLVVSGLKYIQVAEETGYSVIHISNLCSNSAAFKELLDYYQERMTEAMISHHSKIHFAAGLAVELVTEEMMDKADALSPDFKLRAMRELLTFAGYQPVNRNENLNLNAGITKEDLRQIKAESLETAHVPAPTPTQTLLAESTGPDEGNRPVIEATCTERSEVPAVVPEDRRLGVGGRVDGEASTQHPVRFPVG